MQTIKFNRRLSFKGVDARVFFSLFCLFFLSNFYFVIFGSSSLAQGLLVSALFISGLSYNKRLFFGFGQKNTLALIGGSFLLLLISLIVYALSDNLKSLTVLALIPLVFAALCFAQRIAATNTKKLLHTVFVFVVLLMVFGWLGIFGITQYGGYLNAAKGLPPFSEYSHYALSVGLIAVAYIFVASGREFLFIFINLLAQALILPSLTLLVFCVLCFFSFSLRLKSKYYFLFLPLFFSVIVWVLFIFIPQIDYFSSRLSFRESTNITTLVWVQGWELAYKAVFESNGLGLGFQMLGLDESQLTEASYKIQSIAGKYLNIEDGGFLASKLISEAGVIGVAVVLLYVLFVCNFIKNMAIGDELFQAGTGLNDPTRRKAFLGGVFFAFMVEMFFRGYGYFSPGLFLVFAVWLADKVSKRKEILPLHMAGI